MKEQRGGQLRLPLSCYKTHLIKHFMNYPFLLMKSDLVAEHPFMYFKY